MDSDDESDLPNHPQNHVLKKLPTNLRILIRRAPILSMIAIAFIGHAIFGIIEGLAYDFWQRTLIPWISEGSNLQLSFLILGWGMVLVAGQRWFYYYGQTKHKQGQLDSLQTENTKREQKLSDLAVQTTDLTAQVDELHDQLVHFDAITAQLELHCRTINMVEKVIRPIDREISGLVLDRQFGSAVQKRLAQSLLRRLCEMYEEISGAGIRASIYLPDLSNPDFLVIEWSYQIGEEARDVNRWFIGQHHSGNNGNAPHPGLPGKAWTTGQGLVTEDVDDCPDFVELRVPPRPRLPYTSLLHAIIHPDDNEKKLGVLAMDSRGYTFTAHDLNLITQAATRLAWFLYNDQAIHQRIYNERR
jgi:hypothetical protein